MAQNAARDISDLIDAGEVTAPGKRLGREEKEALAEAGTPFVVNEIRYGTDPKTGGYWSVMVTLNGEDTQFNIGEHPRRDTFMQSLSIALAKGPIGGLRLVAYPGQNGNKFVSLEPAFSVS